ncbi:MAG: competence/damage-inducible protein A, partial [Alistipes sp.]|nr:competence/damage-inducible protein A [Alistipes sp.]
MKATIITIGDEILIGQILDTNSRYISRALNAHGIVVAERTSIGDNRNQIVETLDRALSQSEIVIITGGLGPTKDDITKHTLCDYFGSVLRYDEVEAEHIRTLLEARNIAFNELNRGQAMVPECCTVLHNAHGTAPGMWFERNGRVVISLPGVPFEMQHLIDEDVMPRLCEKFELREIVHRTMITFGIAESILAEKITSWEEALPDHLHLAYL